MIDGNGQPRDEAAEKELEGVPEDMLEDEESDDDADGALDDALAALRGDLETAKQDVLYARAETQNVRRRLEKDVQDARNYAATGFARDILSVADNLARAVESVPAEFRKDDKMKGFIAGIEATQRELDKVFGQHGITRIAARGMPLDPNQHQAMIEIPTDEHEPGTVVQEMQAGYMIKDRLLRPAMVGVAKKPG
ncbi:nucleotide exchange factor GrpE [Qipengyuania sp. MTN3-11]|uniref:nucleotide exchange factor GrpE n=1 Tax=Qipengyuania sp. MTN3-11 TaxID=3056557 RepID=UPI0036F2BE32